jgi:alpha-L-rhamnosidase
MASEVKRHLSVDDLSFEYHGPGNALGVGEACPRISWKISCTQANFLQERYQIELYQTQAGNSSACQIPFASVEVFSDHSNLVPWPVEESLRSRQRVYVRVRVWGEDIQEPSTWSQLMFVEAGLLHRSDWQCKRVVLDREQDPAATKPEELYRRQFSLHPELKVCRARLYITAQGVYEAEIDGRRVGDCFMAPGWQSYDHRIHYQTYDVTNHFGSQNIDHCIGVRVAEGWFSGRLGFLGGNRNIWGSQTALILQLEIEYTNGQKDTVSSDHSWVATYGPAQKAEIYHGEKYDSRKEITGWSNFRSQQNKKSNVWTPVKVLDLPPASTNLVAMIGRSARRIETLNPVGKLITPSGKLVVDFGQNLVGYTRIKSVKGPKGLAISFFHAEVLENGECARRPLRDCDAKDEYILNGQSGGESWEPRFTFHGYRYVQVDNWPSTASDILDCLEAVVCHTDMQKLGDFSCSSRLVTKLHENIRWSMRGNFLDVPTDCPQRDERLGWTGDVAIFVPTACFLYDCTGMLMSWLADLAAEQSDRRGIPPLVVPNVIFGETLWAGEYPCAVWNDVCILASWTLYENTGDISILKKQWTSMASWMSVLPRGGGNRGSLWAANSFQLGDWLDPTAPPDSPAQCQTDSQLVANAYLAQCLSIMGKTAAILGKKDDASSYKHARAQVQEDFADEYITANGRITSDSQTAYALAICFDLLPTYKQRQRAGSRLAHIVRANKFRIGTGFVGTPFVCEALTLCGYPQIAYRMLLEEKCPSWLYPVTMGATTVWERWDSMLPNGAVNPGEMTSFNHYALGAVATFLHERLGGLQRLEPGWEKFRAAPTVGADFTKATVSHITPYGEAACSWEIVEKASTGSQVFKMRVLVPPNTTAEVVLPSARANEKELALLVGSGKWYYSEPYTRSYRWPPLPIEWYPGALTSEEY